MNKVVIIGNLGHDIELQYFANGTQYSNIRVAVNEYYKDSAGNKQQRTHWIRCTAFGRTAEVLATYTSKGSKIAIEGSLNVRDWEQDGQKRSAMEVKVQAIELLSSNSGQGSSSAGTKKPGPNAKEQGDGYDLPPDDMPF
jgi:single-strand DNA-binding protein